MPTERCSWYALPPTLPGTWRVAHSGWLSAFARLFVYPRFPGCLDTVLPNWPSVGIFEDAHIHTYLGYDRPRRLVFNSRNRHYAPYRLLKRNHSPDGLLL